MVTLKKENKCQNFVPSTSHMNQRRDINQIDNIKLIFDIDVSINLMIDII